MSKQFWLALMVVAFILAGILIVTDRNKHNTSSTNTQPTQHVEGSGSKNVTLVEYGDYECPICKSFYPAVKQVVTKYQNDIIFQFRELPLTQIHPNAFAGARAAEAAGLQGKYFEMHDLLYENQNMWVSASDPQRYFETYATQLNLNVSRFRQNYASDAVNNAVNADISAFNKTGDEMATPTFYLDGKKLTNTNLIDSTNQPSVDAFSKVIDAEIAKKTATAMH